MKKLLLISFVIFILSFNKDCGICHAQNVGINSSGASPNPSALLDIDASPANNRGFLMPRMTTAQMNSLSAPATGLIVYNTDCNSINYYNGGAWLAIGNTGSVPTPGAITGNTVPCQNATGITYSIAAVSGATGYNWTVPAGASITAGQGTTDITVSFGTTNGSVCVAAYNACGSSNASCTPITLASSSTASAISGTTPVCKSQNGVAYSVTYVPGLTYTWTYSGTGFTVATGQGTHAITANFSAAATSGTLTLTPSNSCGDGTAQTFDITVNTVPDQPSDIIGTTPVCTNQNSVSYSVTDIANVSYAWTYSGSGLTIASGDGTNAITANFSGSATSGTLTITPSNACGNGTAKDFSIAVNTVPGQPGSITGPTTVSPGQTGVGYSVTNVAGVTYTWTYSGTGFSTESGDGTNAIVADFSASATNGTLTVTPSTSCGSGTAQTISVNVGPFVLQPGPEGKDTYYSNSYNTGGAPDAETMGIGGWGDEYYDFVQFDLTTTPSSAQTTTAELWLYVPGDRGNDAQLQIQRITSDWTEGGVTYYSNPSYTFYKAMGGSTATAGWKVTDITDLYKAWKDGTYPNYGVELIPNATWATNSSIVSSDNISIPDNVTYATYRPKLVITTH